MSARIAAILVGRDTDGICEPAEAELHFLRHEKRDSAGLVCRLRQSRNQGARWNMLQHPSRGNALRLRTKGASDDEKRGSGDPRS